MKRKLIFPLLFVLFSGHAWATDIALDFPKTCISIRIRSIEQATGDPSLDWLSYGVTDTLENQMSYLKSCNIIESSDESDNPEAVDRVISGRYRGNEQNLELDLSVRDGKTDVELLRRIYKAPASALLKDLQEIILELAGGLDIPVGKEEKQRVLGRSTNSVAAWKSYSQAVMSIGSSKGHAEKEYLLDILEKSISSAESAVTHDPTYAEAWYLLGELYGVREKEKALSALRRAVALKPFLIPASISLGEMLIETGQIDEGLEFIKQAINVNPSRMSSFSSLFRNLVNAGRKEQCMTLAVQLLRSSFLPALNNGMFVLYTFGDRAVAEDVLTEVLKEEDVDCRAFAVSWLKRIGDSRAVPALSEALGNSNESERLQSDIVEALSEIGDSRAVPALIEALANRDKKLRIRIVSALGEIGDKSGAPPLIGIYGDADEELRESIRSNLQYIAGSSDVPKLIELTKDPDAGTREMALFVLGEVGDRSAVPAVIDATKDPSCTIRARAVSALAQLGDTSVIPLLTQALKDTCWHVRKSAGSGLGHIGDKTAVPALIGSLEDPEKMVGYSVALSLGTIRDKTAIPALISALGHKDYERRSGAVQALGEIKDGASVNALLSTLRDDNWLVRKKSAVALGEIGDKSAVRALSMALSDSHELVRSAAALSLGVIGDPSAANALVKALDDPHKYVAFDAAYALGKIGDKRGLPILRKALLSEWATEKEFNEKIIADIAAKIKADTNEQYGWVSEMTYEFTSYYLMYPKLLVERAAESLSSLGEVKDFYDNFRRFSAKNILILNEIRKRLLFIGNFDDLTSSMDPYLRASGYYLMALEEREKGNYKSQLDHVREALEHISTRGNAGLSILTLWLKTEAELKLGRKSEALMTIRNAESLLGDLSPFEKVGYKEFFRERTLFLKGEAYMALSDRRNAQEAYETGLAELKRERRSNIRAESRGKLEAMLRTSLGVLQVEMGKENLEKALEVGRRYQAENSVEIESEEKRYTELARQKATEGKYEESQRLIEELSLRRIQYMNRKLKLSIADPEKQKNIDEYRKRQSEIMTIAAQIEALDGGDENRRQEPGEDAMLKGLEEERSRKNRELQIYLTNLKKTHPDIAALMGAKPIELTAIQEQLPKNVAIVQYLLLPDKLIIFLIKGAGIEIEEVHIQKSALKEKVQLLRQEIKRMGIGISSERIRPLLSDLYAHLVAPLEKDPKKLQGVTVIGISPNGFLHLLPFGALLNGAEQYLMDRYAIFYINSTSTLGVAMDRSKDKLPQDDSLLAFSNPDGSLEYADIEVQKISQLFKKKMIYSRERARKVDILHIPEGYSILHLSTHGSFDPVDTTQSHLVMSDGNLNIEDIWGLPLKGISLTTLSACETGLGEVLSGDEVVSLENAFIYAGSSAVIATLWKVDAISTAELIYFFYENLLTKGMAKAEALTTAQKELQKKYNHPFFWAAFTLRGNWR